MLICEHQMAAFRAVSHDDQIQLLKGGSIELLILRSVLTFDKDKQQFLDPLDPEEKAAVKVRYNLKLEIRSFSRSGSRPNRG